MAINPIGLNQGSQSYVRFEDDGGTVNTQVIDVRQGSVALTSGSLSVTVGTLTRIQTIGTLEVGTISALPNLPQGSIQVTAGTVNAGTIDLLKAGTITKLEGGTLGVVSSLTTGSVVVTTGTVNAGTVDLVKAGTITRVEGGTLGILSQGSINVTAGTVAVTLGTIVSHTSLLDLNNVSTGTLAANGTYTGTATNILGYDGIVVSAYSDVASAANGLQVQFSYDGTNFDHTFLNSVPANDEKSIDFYARAKFYKVTYINGTTAQGTFRLNTLLKLSTPAPTTKELGLTLGSTDMAMVTHSIIAGTSSSGGGSIIEVKVNPSGAINVAGVLDGLSTGTITTGSLSNVAMLNAGTITRLEGGTLGRVGNVGTLEVGTISTLPNIPGGTLALVTRVGNVGTLEVGTISTLPNIPGGTIGVVSSLTTGSVVVTNGTIGAGTVAVSAGTITHGTIDAGTVRMDARTTQNIVTFGTQVAGTAAIAATIVGSASVGAGTSLWLNNFSIVNPYGSVLTVLGFGTAQQGTNVFWRGVLGTQTGIGIEKEYPKLSNAGMTNQDLVLSLGAAGTVDLSISYLISA